MSQTETIIGGGITAIPAPTEAFPASNAESVPASPPQSHSELKEAPAAVPPSVVSPSGPEAAPAVGAAALQNRAIAESLIRSWQSLSKEDSHSADLAWMRLKAHQPIAPALSLLRFVENPDAEPKAPDHLRFVCISDTHSRIEDPSWRVPAGDVLIHGGDFCMVGTPAEVNKFCALLDKLPHKHKIVIAGNHDHSVQQFPLTGHLRHLQSMMESGAPPGIKSERDIRALLNKHCIYLQDQECIIEGIRLYGSPWQPLHAKGAFQIDREDPALEEKWRHIPEGIDVLITHGPPLGRCDLSRHNVRAGCVELLRHVQTRVKPLVHVFGHIHEARGVSCDGNTVYINASSCDREYKLKQPAYVFDLPIPKAAAGGKPTIRNSTLAPAEPLTRNCTVA